MSESIYQFNVNTINGEELSLSQYKGKAMLIVNTASRCGYTPQYAELEQLYQRYKDKNFEILAFPCNQFGMQEPGESEEIANFCSTEFNISFPLFEKIEVNGAKAHPLFKFLTNKLPGLMGIEAVKWNFTKFLIDPNGMPVKRFAPKDKPLNLVEHIEQVI